MIHLVGSTCAAELLRTSLGLSDVVAFGDPLSVGPVTSDDDELPKWITRRLAFWAAACGAHDSDAQVAARELQRCLDSDALTLWIGVGPDDQLLAAWLCSELVRLRRSPRLEVVQFASTPTPRGDEMRVAGVGLLSRAEIAEHPEAKELNTAGVDRFARMWTAWSADDPTALVEMSQKTGSDVVLRDVASRLLDRYPDLDSGLSRWDLALLRNLREHGPMLPRAIGHTLSESFDSGDLVGDAWLFWRARRLGARHLPFPLVALSSESLQMRDVSVELTRHGVAVLEGSVNAVSLNGVHDHIGGVHLDSACGRVWFRTREGLDKPSTVQHARVSV